MSIIGEKGVWPPDSTKCVFVGHALDRIGNAETCRALRSGTLHAGVIVVGAKDWRTPTPVSPLAFLNIDPTQFAANGQIDWLDKHPGTPVRHRRRIPVPHWVYVTRVSLDAVARGPAASRRGVRYSSDAVLVAEAVAAIKGRRLPNPHKAAQVLAARAEGASQNAKVDRLRRKIAAALGK
jgi:hypothetical protein